MKNEIMVVFLEMGMDAENSFLPNEMRCRHFYGRKNQKKRHIYFERS